MALLFYDHKEKPYGVFSNFATYPITIDGKDYPTTEHYYQACKFIGSEDAEEYAELIRAQSTPMKAKVLATQKIGGGYKWKTDLNPIIQEYLGRGVKLREDWEDVKDHIMRRAVYVKFSSYPDLRDILVGIKQRHLVEHTSRDSYWGDGGDGTGRNMLGWILMETRELLQPSRQGPLSKSNFVIYGSLLMSAYPGDRDNRQTSMNIFGLVDYGVDVFVSLQTNEESDKLCSYVTPHLFEETVEWGPDEYAMYEGISRGWGEDGKEERIITLRRCQVPDRGVVDDELAQQVAQDIVDDIGRGKCVLVHCLGGKGRTGTISCLVLGKSMA